MELDLPRDRVDAGGSELWKSELVSQVKTSAKAPLARFTRSPTQPVQVMVRTRFQKAHKRSCSVVVSSRLVERAGTLVVNYLIRFIYDPLRFSRASGSSSQRCPGTLR